MARGGLVDDRHEFSHQLSHWLKWFGFIYPIIGSMGRTVYLPIHGWLIFYGINVGKYTSPMDPSWVLLGWI